MSRLFFFLHIFKKKNYYFVGVKKKGEDWTHFYFSYFLFFFILVRIGEDNEICRNLF